MGKIVILLKNVVILCHTDADKIQQLINCDEGGDRMYRDVIIGNNVFIGVNSVILLGVTIGDNVVIEALTLVNRDLKSGSIVRGVPARIISKSKRNI